MALSMFMRIKIVRSSAGVLLLFPADLMTDPPPPLIFSGSGTESIYPVADATTFFTDLHYILRVTAAGNTRTVCHNRLNLLEHVIML
jgi:hypothetical protein